MPFIQRLDTLEDSFRGLSRSQDHNMAIPDVDKRMQLPLVKGGAKNAPIAVAFILAKVTRDQIVNTYAVQYPKYNFDNHKRYSTKNHIEAIKKYGL